MIKLRHSRSRLAVWKGQHVEKEHIHDLARDIGYSDRRVRDQRVAWYASHRHLPAADTLYDYGYMFAYRLEIPAGASSITLPDARFVRVMAMSVGDEAPSSALQSPFEDLHRDAAFRARFARP